MLACRGGASQRALPVSASQAWTTPSAPAVRTHELSGPNRAAVTGPLWRSGGDTGSWSAAERTRAYGSPPNVTIKRPSGLVADLADVGAVRATVLGGAGGARRTQNRARPSWLAVNTPRPSGLNVRAVGVPMYP